jgi:hypothetical protein
MSDVCSVGVTTPADSMREPPDPVQTVRQAFADEEREHERPEGRQSMTERSRDIAAGLMFVVIGGTFLLDTLLNLDVGRAAQMGPGYFPMALSVFLIGLGIAIGLAGLGSSAPISFAIPWRAIFFISLGPLVYALTVKPLGFVLAVFMLVFLCALANRSVRLTNAVLLAAGLTLIATLIFKLGLNLPFELIGPVLDRIGGGGGAL